MSHEMRTPMNVIVGMSALLKNTDEIKKIREYAGKMDVASGWLMKLIDDVLDMYDIEGNNLVLLDSEFSFTKMMQSVVKRLNPDMEEKKHKLLVDADLSIPDTLIGDGKRIAQVVLNLLANACKFTPQNGEIKINSILKEKQDDSVTVQIDVIDNGIGISGERIKMLFSPFEQADGGAERRYNGAGLGLAISKHIAVLSGGDIRIESEEGSGSKFSFTFNVKTKGTAAAAQDVSVSFKGKTALLVDDIEINREIVMAILEDTGLEIISAVSGSSGLDIFMESPDKFDIVLMDINMPEMDGVEVTRRIRAFEADRKSRTQTNAQLREVPVIAMTANVLKNEVDKYIEAGMSDHIGKPVDPEIILSKLKKYLGAG
jgi:CheY-like chemotaxis protein